MRENLLVSIVQLCMAEYRRSCATYVTYRATACYHYYESPSSIPVVALAGARRQSRTAGLYSGTFGHASPFVPRVYRQKRHDACPKQYSRRFSSYRPRHRRVLRRPESPCNGSALERPREVSPWRRPFPLACWGETAPLSSSSRRPEGVR